MLCVSAVLFCCLASARMSCAPRSSSFRAISIPPRTAEESPPRSTSCGWTLTHSQLSSYDKSNHSTVIFCCAKIFSVFLEKIQSKNHPEPRWVRLCLAAHPVSPSNCPPLLATHPDCTPRRVPLLSAIKSSTMARVIFFLFKKLLALCTVFTCSSCTLCVLHHMIYTLWQNYRRYRRCVLNYSDCFVSNVKVCLVCEISWAQRQQTLVELGTVLGDRWRPCWWHTVRCIRPPRVIIMMNVVLTKVFEKFEKETRTRCLRKALSSTQDTIVGRSIKGRRSWRTTVSVERHSTASAPWPTAYKHTSSGSICVIVEKIHFFDRWWKFFLEILSIEKVNVWTYEGEPILPAQSQYSRRR